MSSDIAEAAQHELNRETQAIWEAKAAFWDERMGEGNAFQRVLIGPATERLLGVRPGQEILEIACGNGVMSRRLASLGAHVVATDFSAAFLERARARSRDHADRIDYQLVDATDEDQIRALGDGRFDAAVCNMALMDMAAIAPLMRGLVRVLKPGCPFVFSVMHPAFNNPAGTTLGLEEEDRAGRLVETYYIKVTRYLHVPPTKGVGMADEPLPHYYVHRTLSSLLGACFAVGFVLDGLEEPAFGPQDGQGRPLSWLAYTQIPPVLAARLRSPEPDYRGVTSP